MKVNITYLLNSGFLVDAGENLLIFDAFDDPSGTLDSYIKSEKRKPMYFFVSHAHFDHFNGFFLAHYNDVATKFILSEDIQQSPTVAHINKDKIQWMGNYEELGVDDINVQSYSSTDAGTSFEIGAAGVNIYHAGDFNWWDWIGDTIENRRLSENAFRKQLKSFIGKKYDVVFFPVDGRLESSMEKGVQEFCRQAAVEHLISMHSVSYPEWIPSGDCFQNAQNIPSTVWSPIKAGEQKIYEL